MHILLHSCELLEHPHSRSQLYGNVLIAEGMQEQLYELVRFPGCEADRFRLNAGAIPFVARDHYCPTKIKLTFRSQCQTFVNLDSRMTEKNNS